MNFQAIIYSLLPLFIDVFGKNNKILGGTTEVIIDYPFIATMRIKNTEILFCAGVIIGAKHLLSTAHCFEDVAQSQIIIRTGTSSSISTYGPSFLIKNLYIHPHYSRGVTPDYVAHHDIAVVELNERILFNEFQNKINLPIQNWVHEIDCSILGWGLTDYPVSKIAVMLQKASVKVISNQECSRITGLGIKDEQICATSSEGVGACIGDSGGPLISNFNELIGLTSFIKPCATGEPDIFTRVYPYLDFIMPIITRIY